MDALDIGVDVAETILQTCYLCFGPEPLFLSCKNRQPGAAETTELTEVFQLLLWQNRIVVRALCDHNYLSITDKDTLTFTPTMSQHSLFSLERPLGSPANSLRLVAGRNQYVDLTNIDLWIVTDNPSARATLCLVPVKEAVLQNLQARRGSFTDVGLEATAPSPSGLSLPDSPPLSSDLNEDRRQQAIADFMVMNFNGLQQPYFLFLFLHLFLGVAIAGQ